MAKKQRKPKAPDPATFGFDIIQHVIKAMATRRPSRRQWEEVSGTGSGSGPP